MPKHNADSTLSGGAARPRRRRGRLTPIRRIRRFLTTGLCAGAAVLSGAAAHAQQPVSPASYYGGYGPYYRPPCATCPPSYAPYYAPTAPSDQAPTEAPPRDADAQTPTPDTTPDEAPFTAPTPAPTAATLSGATGTPAAPASATPNMIGDFFATGSTATLREVGGIGAFADPDGVQIPDPTESVVGRIKQAENFSPLPADRIFLDYTAYHNVPIGPARDANAPRDVDVVRLTPGFERTFLDGMMSVELRMPVAQTVSSTLNYASTLDLENWEPGDLTVVTKLLLLETNRLSVAGGLGIRTPTANDLIFTDEDTIVEVTNEAVHLLPYFAAVATPNDTFFAQAMLQVDVDTNGNDVYLNDVFQGTLQDQTFLYNSYVLGAWLYDNPCSRTLNSIAATTEFHYSTALNDPDEIANGQLILTEEDVVAGDSDDRFDTLVGVVGLHLLYAGGAQVTFAYGVPLTEERFADGEFRMLLNLGQPFGALGARAGAGR